MPLVNYRPREGLTARLTCVVSLLAIFTLGLYQLERWVRARGAEDIIAAEAPVTADIVERMWSDPVAVTDALGQRNFVADLGTFSPITLTFQRTQGEYEVGDPAARERLLEALRGTEASATFTEDVLVDQRVGGNGAELTAEDLKQVADSPDPPAVLSLVGGEKTRDLAGEGSLEGEMCAELVPAGATAGQARTAGVGLTRVVTWAAITMREADWRTYYKDEVADAILAEEVTVVLDPGEPDNPDDDQTKVIPAGIPLAEIKVDPELEGHLTALPLPLRCPAEQESCQLRLPLNVSQSPEDTLAEAVYEATQNITVRETVRVGAQSIGGKGDLVTPEVLARAQELGERELDVVPERMTMRPSRAAGQSLADPVTFRLPAGENLDTTGEIELLRALDPEGAESRTIPVARRSEPVVLEPDRQEEIRGQLVGQELAEPKLRYDERVVWGKVPASPQAPWENALTVTEVYAQVQAFNETLEGHEELHQDFGDLTLVVLENDEVELAATLDNRDKLAGVVLTRPIVVEGRTVFEAGHRLGRADLTQFLGLMEEGALVTGYPAVETPMREYARGPGVQHQIVKDVTVEPEGWNLPAGDYTAAVILENLPATPDRAETIFLVVRLPGEEGAEDQEMTWTLRRIMDYAAIWAKRVYQLEEVTESVPETVYPAGTEITPEVFQALWDEFASQEEVSQRTVSIRGETTEVKATDLRPGDYVLAADLEGTLAKGTVLRRAVGEALEASGTESVQVVGVPDTRTLDEIREWLDAGMRVELASNTQAGGTVLVERGTTLTCEIVQDLLAAGFSSLRVSGGCEDVPRELVDPGRVACEPGGIAFPAVATFATPGAAEATPVGAGTLLTADLYKELSNRRTEGELRFPLLVSSGGSTREVSDSEEDWHALADLLPVQVRARQSLVLPGPMGRTLLRPPGARGFVITGSILMAVGLFVVLLYVLWRVLNHKKLSDLLADTEQEMRKVSWPTKEELWGSTQVVVFTVLILAIFLVVSDFVLNRLVLFILTP